MSEKKGVKLKECIRLPMLRINTSTEGKTEPLVKSTKFGNGSPMKAVIDYFSKEPKSKKDKILLIKSGTGTGKTTLIPYFLMLKDRNEEKLKKIICTQPRKNNINNAEMITKGFRYEYAEEIYSGDSLTVEQTSDENYSANIGVKMLTKSTVRSIESDTPTFLDFYIDQSFYNNLIKEIKKGNEDVLRQYSYIILDEVHERTLSMDLILTRLQHDYSLLHEDNLNDFPNIIIMSATFNVEKFARYFDVWEDTDEINQSHVLIISAESPYSIQINDEYRNNDSYISAGVKIIMDIDKNHKDDTCESDTIHETCKDWEPDMRKPKSIARDILFFLPTVAAIEEVVSLIKKEMKNHKDLKILQAYHGISDKILNDIMAEPEKTLLDIEGKPFKSLTTRRVILSTNFLETGTTVNCLGYVIDSGLVNLATYNPVTRATIMEVQLETCNNRDQRKGRVGRTCSGVFYPLYTKETEENFNENPLSSLISSKLDIMLLNLLEEYSPIVSEESIKSNPLLPRAFDVVRNIKFLDTPIPELIHDALSTLYTLGAIDIDSRITNTGRQIAKLVGITQSVEVAKLIVMSSLYQCTTAAVIIATFIETMSDNQDTINKILSYNSAKINIPYFLKSDFVNCVHIWNTLQEEVRFLMKIKLNSNGEQLKEWILTSFVNAFRLTPEDKLMVEVEKIYQNIMHISREINRKLFELSMIIPIIDEYKNVEVKSKDEYDIFMNALYKNTERNLTYYTNFKKCIAESFISNRAVLNEETSDYVVESSYIPNLDPIKRLIIPKVDISSFVSKEEPKAMKQFLPKNIVFASLTLDTDKKAGKHEYRIKYISEIEK